LFWVKHNVSFAGSASVIKTYLPNKVGFMLLSDDGAQPVFQTSQFKESKKIDNV
jgi:hypothetical protein